MPCLSINEQDLGHRRPEGGKIQDNTGVFQALGRFSSLRSMCFVGRRITGRRFLHYWKRTGFRVIDSHLALKGSLIGSMFSLSKFSRSEESGKQVNAEMCYH